MKANKAPERLYLSKTIYSTYLYQVPDPDDDTAIEYIRTDAFIKKACDAFCKVCKMPNCRRNECKAISNFKEYLETI